ncbi:MAG TPA: hypothetical protein VGN57_18940 [Pirellulaceae bacterium]|jgi:hypothetical protein|nr:hypothetical protein [Pirellulaceae bacterium]
MTHRQLDPLSSGTTHAIDFETTYAKWTDEEKEGTEIEATGFSGAKFMLKRHLLDSDEDAVVAKTLGSGITIENGMARVLLEPTDTAALQGSYFASLRLNAEDGSVVDWKDEDYAVPYIEVPFVQGAVESLT